MDVAFFSQIAVNAIMLGLIYALIAFGFSLIFGISSIFNFAHGETYMMSAVIAYYLITVAGIPGPLGILVCALVVAIIGLGVEWLFYRPVRPKGLGVQDMFPPMIISVSLVSIIPAAIVLIAGTNERSVPSLISGTIAVGSVLLSQERLIIMAVALAVFVGLLFFIWKHREGRAMAAVAQDYEAAMLQGVSLQKTNSIAFAIGFALAAVAAALLAPIYYVDPTMGPAALLTTFIVVILGGVGSLPGTLIGGIILGVINSFGAAYLPGGTPTLAAFVLVMIILIIRPKGLMGHD